VAIRWLHLYLSAPPPSDFLARTPLLDAPFPFMVCLTELPDNWGYRTYFQLPPDIVSGVLKHDHVYVSPDFETGGGLKGLPKLPGHTAFRKKASQAKRGLQTKKDKSKSEAVEIIQQAAEAEVKHLVDLVELYAKHRVSLNRDEDNSTASADQEHVKDQALDRANFEDWLKSRHKDWSSNSSETLCFYLTFFQTQLCCELLHKEIEALFSESKPFEALTGYGL